MAHDAGRLKARPTAAGSSSPPEPGLHPLGLSAGRDGLLYVPARYDRERPAPLVAMLHGAGSQARPGLAPLLPVADAAGLLLIAVNSHGRTWDMILGGYGPDVAFLDAALEQTYSSIAVDSSRLALGGFSDGASYALSLALGNGDLFTHVLAFSPGFVAPPAYHLRPRIFVSHGIHDRVLPVDRCGRRVVRLLRAERYEVEYVKFDGPHSVPDDIARRAVGWLGVL